MLMTPGRVQDESLRLDRFGYTRLIWALAISLAFHLFCFGSYELGKKFNLWQALQLPEWLRRLTPAAVMAKQPKKNPSPNEVPLVFVDVSQQQESKEVPKDTPYYSSRNSQAGGPDADKDSNIPKINGQQTQVIKTEDVPRSPYDKLQPDFSHQNSQDQEAEKAKPTQPVPPGDLAMAKPDAQLRPDDGKADQPRPRTIKEALSRQHRSQLSGDKMKQEGSTQRLKLDPGFDVKATPFGQYDAEFIQAVQERWFNLLDNMSVDGYRPGRVVVRFHLNYDGRITDMKVLDNNVGEMLGLLCQKAVLDPAPYDKWPREMRLLVDKDYREITFTFYYN
jgi:hypothetical protein